MSAAAHNLVVAASAERSLARLPDGVAAAVVEFMVGPLVESPQRVGHPLVRKLADLWSARRGPYFIVYQIDDARHEVTVLRVDHSADIYRPR